jgi:hypothetical protein
MVIVGPESGMKARGGGASDQGSVAAEGFAMGGSLRRAGCVSSDSGLGTGARRAREVLSARTGARRL